jgi:hypothetical protein
MTGPEKSPPFLRWLKRDRRGIASIEFAIVSGVLLTIVLAICDIGNMVQERMVMQRALRAGGLYARSFPTQTDGIVQAMQASLRASWPNDWSSVVIDPPESSYACMGSSVPVIDPGNCDGIPRYYVRLNVTRPYTPFLLSFITGNSVSYVVRVQ